MKFILKTISYIVFFIAIFIALLPKENLYFMGVKKLYREKIELSQTSIVDNYFGLKIQNLNIKYENIDVADISKLDIATYIFSTKIDIRNIIVNSAFNKFAPQTIRSINISHSILDPLKIDISSKFTQGEAKGYVDLLNRVIKIDIIVSRSFRSKYRQLTRVLKKVKNKDKKREYYSYEYKF